jgi:hypothetical protein
MDFWTQALSFNLPRSPFFAIIPQNEKKERHYKCKQDQ